MKKHSMEPSRAFAMVLSCMIVLVTVINAAAAAEDHFAQRGGRAAAAASSRYPSLVAFRQGSSAQVPGASQKPTSQLRTDVTRLEKSIRGHDLRLLVLHNRDQSIESLSTIDSTLGGQQTRVVCPASVCPALTPCPAVSFLREDSPTGSCLNPDLEDKPSGAERKVVEFFPQPSYLNRFHSALDICLPNITGAPGDLVRPGCPWSGDKWGGSKVQPEGAGRLRDGWAGQVFVLEDVYLDAFGRVFNSTHRFDAEGCPVAHQLAYGKGTKVVAVEEAVNLLGAAPDPSPDPVAPGLRATGLPWAPRKTSVFHAMVYELPMLLPVMRMLPHLNRTLLATANLKFHRTISAHLTGTFPWGAMLKSISAPAPETLWLVRKLVQPVFQPCNQPSPSLWGQMREAHLLPPQILETARRLKMEQKAAPRTMAIPREWVVVVHRKALNVLVKGTSVLALLEQFFPRTRIALFRTGFHVTDWDLFNRAALFITVQHASIANVMFMPPYAAVLQLRPAPRGVTPGLDSDLGVSLAEACDVRAHIGFCDQGTEQGSWLCDPYPILDVIDMVSHHVYTAFEPQRVRREGSSSPGVAPKENWFTKSEAEVRDVEKWASCVSDRGSWVYNPKPRILPWEYSGSLTLCDFRHSRTKGLITLKSDEFVAAGGLAKDWNVRESLKYDWVIPNGECPVNKLAPEASFVEFSGEGFCHKVGKGRTFLFLGDSLTEQFTSAFLNNMLKDVPKPASWAISEEIPQECIDWLLPNGTAHHLFCRDIRFHSDVCPGLRVLFVRNDYLQLSNRREFDTMEFSRFSFLNDVDVALVNRGAHYRPTDLFARDLKALFRYFRNRFPGMLVVYRNTPPGHDGCESAELPIKSRQDPNKLPYNWGQFREQNEVARQLAIQHDCVYMDVDTMTALRPDSHKGITPSYKDCLHYCTPGPVDLWPQHFFNTMLWVHPLKMPSRRQK